ncbi:hypothetical protein BS78_05G069100 [Paspalum vaginatum]|nr:hypothetical protein BS78_05G069100 [Paspalum vaginatum]
MHISMVVHVHLGVVPANNLSLIPRSPPKRKPLAMKLPSETHALQARNTHPAFGSIFSTHGSSKLQSNYPRYLPRQGGLSRAEFLVCAQGNTTSQTEGNCFGEVVGDTMLAEFGMQSSKENRARLALRLKNDEEKKGQASRYVANLKDRYGYGSSTSCLVYNATGDTLRYHDYHDWFRGSLYEREYPKEIGNGQWAAFLHVHRNGDPTGSVGAVVYRGKHTPSSDERDFLLAWYTPWSDLTRHNKAYCNIGPVDSYKDRWDEIRTALEESSYTSRSSADGVEVDAYTDGGTSPTFIAIIKQQARGP